MLETNSFSLSLEDGALAGVVIDDIVQTISPLTITQPVFNESSIPHIFPDETFHWTPSGASWIAFRFVVMDAVTQNPLQELYCVTEDDGVFQIDPNLWEQWSIGTRVNIYITRNTEFTQMLPHNLAQTRMIGSFTTIGAAFTK